MVQYLIKKLIHYLLSLSMKWTKRKGKKA